MILRLKGRSSIFRASSAMTAAPAYNESVPLEKRYILKTVLVATCKTWGSPAMLPYLLRDARASVSAFSPWHLSLNPYVREHVTASRDAAEAATQLVDLLSYRRFDWVVIADDYLLEAVVERCDLADPPPWLPFDRRNGDALSLLLSKHEFAERAPRFGIPVAESYFASTIEEVTLQANRFGFPIVVKGEHGSAGDAVFIAHDLAALQRESAKLLLASKRVLVQRFVKGPLAAADVLYDRGEVVGYSPHLLDCHFPFAVSASTVRARFVHPALDAIVGAVGAATGFHGLAGINLVQDEKTGELYVLEVNPRPTAGFSDGPASRAFFAPLVAAFLEGKAARARVYDGPTSAQFPAYLLYFLLRSDKRSLQSYRRAFNSLAKFRPDNAGLAAWEIARFVRDQGRRLRPKVFVDAMKGIFVSVLGPAVWLLCKTLEWVVDQYDRYVESVTRRAR